MGKKLPHVIDDFIEDNNEELLVTFIEEEFFPEEDFPPVKKINDLYNLDEDEFEYFREQFNYYVEEEDDDI